MKLEKLLLRLGLGEENRYRLLFRMSQRSVSLFWEGYLSVRDDVAAAS